MGHPSPSPPQKFLALVFSVFLRKRRLLEVGFFKPFELESLGGGGGGGANSAVTITLSVGFRGGSLQAIGGICGKPLPERVLPSDDTKAMEQMPK